MPDARGRRENWAAPGVSPSDVIAVAGSPGGCGACHTRINRRLSVKVVIFCGGKGLRMREASEVLPKPMIPIGNRPILWHIMKYYAHFGLKDFVLCLGYRAEAIKDFFLNYDEAAEKDFVVAEGGATVHLLKTDIHDWNITFVDTGLQSKIGERLRAVRHLLRDDEFFLANYGDTLTDAHLPTLIDRAAESEATASFLAV